MLLLHVSQEHAIPILSLHRQTISNLSIHTGRQESQWILGKYLRSVKLSTNGSNQGAKNRPPRATIVVAPPKIDEPDVIFRDKLLCYNRSYPQVHSPTLSLSITVVIEVIIHPNRCFRCATNLPRRTPEERWPRSAENRRKHHSF